METYTDTIERPLSGVEEVKDIDRFGWPDPNWFDYGRLGWFADNPDAYLPASEWAEENRDYARVVGGWSPIFSRITEMFGMEEGLINMASRPDLIRAAVAHIGDFYENYYEQLANACNSHADILAFGDDFAGQNGMLIDPQKWREYFLPLWKRLFAIAHRHGMKAMKHMCGGVRPVLGDLIDAGLDIYEVVQVTSGGMEPKKLKIDFGSHLTLYGAIDEQGVLTRGTPDEVKRHVREMIDVFGKGGRFILASMHFLQDDVPIENVLAMYEEALSDRQNGRLGIGRQKYK